MSFKASNAEFDLLFVKKNMTRIFLQRLRVYLERHKDLFPYSELLKAFGGKMNLAVFACREDVADDMYMALLVQQIPCLRVATTNGRTGFVIPGETVEKVISAQDMVLKEKAAATRHNIMTGQQLLSGHLDPDKRNVTVISKLSKIEAYHLMKLAHDKLLLQNCAIDEMMDGSYTFSLYQEDTLKSHNKVTLAQIYLQMQLDLLGPYGDIIVEKTNRTIEMDQFIGSDFNIKKYNNGNKVAILGDKNNYMIIEEKRFEYGYIKEKDGEKIFVKVVEADRSLHDYPDRLRTCAMRISNPLILRDERDLSTIEYQDLSKTNSEIRYEISISNVLHEVGEMLLDRSREDAHIFMYGDTINILKNTIKESAKILLSAAGGICPYEYTTDQIESFRKTVEDNHLNLVPFHDAFEKMSEISVYGKARPIQNKETTVLEKDHGEPDEKELEEAVEAIDSQDLWMEWGEHSL